MSRFFKRILLLSLGMAAIHHASAFSVFGPAETWQTSTLDYQTRYYYGDTEWFGPKNFNEGSRLNTAIITYAYDYTFVNFFGTKGIAAVDAAMAEMNALPPSSQMNINKYLMQGNEMVNYTAQALSLTDLKSTVMSLMMEHMGLCGETHVWDLLSRNGPTALGPCDFQYTVINRNYDPVTYEPSAYVNGTQYYYSIWDGCPVAVNVADAIENTSDETSDAQWVFTAVATREALRVGGYYLGLTYDDVGGIKYLYNQNRFMLEALESNVVAAPSYGTWLPVNTGVTNASGGLTNLYLGGVEKVRFVKLNWALLPGNTFIPLHYNYSIPWVQNGKVRTLRVTRTITQPDIIFAAGDLVANNTGAGTVGYSVYPEGYDRTNTFILNGFIGYGANPVVAQVIAPEETITFNDITPVYENYSPSYLDQYQYGVYPILQWGSFDGTTNAPEVYPDGSSIASLEAQVLAGAGTTVSAQTWNPLTVVTNATTTTGSSAAP